MDTPKPSRRQLLKAAGALGAAAAALDFTNVLADDDDSEGRVSWDIVSVGTGCIRPGGDAAATAQDGSTITVTGHGTFPNRDRCSRRVTGGGTWTIAPGTGGDSRCFKGSGTYRVVELLSWHPAPGGTVPLPDCTGDRGMGGAGLVRLRVVYTDGTTGQRHPGTLTVSCHLPGAPHCMEEGITASVVYEDFWKNQPPTGDHNRTLFHVGTDGESDD